MCAYVKDDFRRWGDSEKSARVASYSHEGVIELMPASDAVTYASKYVNRHPSNPGRELQTVTAFGVLADRAHELPDLLG